MASIPIESLKSRYGDLPLEGLAHRFAEDESRATSQQVQYVICYRSLGSPAPDYMAACFSPAEVDKYYRSPDSYSIQVLYKKGLDDLPLESLRSRYGALPLEGLAQRFAEDESRATSRQVQYVIRYGSRESPTPDYVYVAACFSLEEVDKYYRRGDTHSIQVLYKLDDLPSLTAEVLEQPHPKPKRDIQRHDAVAPNSKETPISTSQVSGNSLSQMGPLILSKTGLTLGRGVILSNSSNVASHVESKPSIMEPRPVHLAEVLSAIRSAPMPVPTAPVPVDQAMSKKLGIRTWLRGLLGQKWRLRKAQLQCAYHVACEGCGSTKPPAILPSGAYCEECGQKRRD